MNATKPPHRAIAILSLPPAVPKLITCALGIVTRMTNNPSFASPIPTLAAVQAAIDDLEEAEVIALMRTRGAAAARDAKRAVLVSLLEPLRAYVQTIADANPENGPAIIESAGFTLRKIPVMPPRGFKVERGAVSGTVKLVVPATARRAAYDWQYSVDGGKTWLEIVSTLQSRTEVTGLTPLTTTQFRYRTLTKTGRSDWSQPASIVVL
jgi:hypothetical protein